MGSRLSDLARRSRLELVGLAVFALGGLLDLVYHTLPPGPQALAERYLGTDGSYAHLVTFVGMLLIALALVAAARQARSR